MRTYLVAIAHALTVGSLCVLLLITILAIIGSFTGLNRILTETGLSYYVWAGEILMLYVVTPFSARILARGETNQFFSVLSAVCFLVVQALFYLPGTSERSYILSAIIFIALATGLFFWRTRGALERMS